MSEETLKFIDPNGSNIEEVKKTFTNATQLLIEHLTSANHKELLAQSEDLDNIRIELPKYPIDNSRMEVELQTLIDLSMNPANSSYIGHMDSLPTAYSIIGSL